MGQRRDRGAGDDNCDDGADPRPPAGGRPAADAQGAGGLPRRQPLRGPGKDGIPAIDDPAFQAAAEADAWLDDGDRVVGLYHDGEARAYPQSILVWHEIVNDTVAGENIAVTYCPLTGTALGYLRGETTLGVSGRLVNSNLIMFDRASDSLWPQILSAGIGGPHEGQGLEEVRVVWTTWGRWRERHPDTRVLTTDTGYLRNYNRDPYGGYKPVRGYYAPGHRPSSLSARAATATRRNRRSSASAPPAARWR